MGVIVVNNKKPTPVFAGLGIVIMAQQRDGMTVLWHLGKDPHLH
jgi:hypothetical protein